MWRGAPVLATAASVPLTLPWRVTEGQSFWLHLPGRVLLPRTLLAFTGGISATAGMKQTHLISSSGIILWDLSVGSLVLLFCGFFLSFCWYPLYTSIIFNISCFLFVLSLSISVPGFYSQCRQPELHQTDNEDTWIKCATGYFILLFILGTTTKIPKEAYTSMWKIWVFCNKLIFNYYLGTPLKFYFLSILDF